MGRKKGRPNWSRRRVCIVLSDDYHTLHTMNLWGAVRMLDPSPDTTDNLPVIEAPLDGLLEKAKQARPDFFEGRELVGVLCADWSMWTHGAIVWLKPTKKGEFEEGADKLITFEEEEEAT